MSAPAVAALAADLVTRWTDEGVLVATAESCTGGMVAAALTDIPGSSAVFDRGVVSYSNLAKIELLGVDAHLLEAYGAVSEAVARAMAEGILTRSSAVLSVAVTGIAGPDGGTADKPVGLVHLAAARRNGPTVHRACRYGAIGRGAVRRASVADALGLLDEISRS
ncbi:MAG: CinA family protein [Alphaproteobacteria bacterium]